MPVKRKLPIFVGPAELALRVARATVVTRPATMVLMTTTCEHGIRLLRPRSALLAFIAVAAALGAASCSGDSDSDSFPGPWGSNTIRPAELVRELAGSDKPVVVCTGPPMMYRAGHVPGAVLHGPTSEPAVVSELTAWAAALPRSTNLVVYCGCCPIAHCPTLRPAWAALKGLGFTRLRVLALPENFGTDWAAKGYPVEQ